MSWNLLHRRSQSLILPLLLVGCLTLSTGCVNNPEAIAPPQDGASSVSSSVVEAVRSPEPLPSALADQVLADAARRFAVSQADLEITQSNRETWPDGCLGLPRAGEFCTQALVEGWAIEVRHGSAQQTWQYRTDSSGQTMRVSP